MFTAVWSDKGRTIKYEVMKTICIYFQVHQPMRLKKYRFFNMGKDHEYLDDYANRAIMQLSLIHI